MQLRASLTALLGAVVALGGRHDDNLAIEAARLDMIATDSLDFAVGDTVLASTRAIRNHCSPDCMEWDTGTVGRVLGDHKYLIYFDNSFEYPEIRATVALVPNPEPSIRPGLDYGIGDVVTWGYANMGIVKDLGLVEGSTDGLTWETVSQAVRHFPLDGEKLHEGEIHYVLEEVDLKGALKSAPAVVPAKRLSLVEKARFKPGDYCSVLTGAWSPRQEVGGAPRPDASHHEAGVVKSLSLKRRRAQHYVTYEIELVESGEKVTRLARDVHAV